MINSLHNKFNFLKREVLKLFEKSYSTSLYFELLSVINKRDYAVILLLQFFINLIDILNIGLFVSIIFKNSFLSSLPEFEQLFSKEYKILFLILFIMIRSFIRIKSNIFLINFNAKFSDQMKENLFNKVLNANNEDLDKFGKNELFNVLNLEINRTVNALDQGATLIKSLFSFCVYLISILLVSWSSLFVIILGTISILITTIIQKYGALGIGLAQSKLLLDLQKIIGDSLHGLKLIRANNGTEWFLGKLKSENKKNRKFARKVLSKKLFYKFYGEVITLVLFSLWLIQNSDSYELGFIVTNILLLIRLSNNLTNIVDSRRNTVSSLSGFLKLKKVNLLLKIKENSKYQDLVPKLNTKKNRIIEISWKYKKKENSFLKLTLKKPSICVLIGNSGSGKTTFLDLFSGLLNPRQSFWKIRLDNGKYYEFSGDDGEHVLRDLLSYCTQETFLFEGSLKENLLLSNFATGSDYLDIDKTIKDYLIQFELNNILKRDYSFEKPLNLSVDFYSGGEKKRLGLIRSFLQEKPIEIYDEPTSYLDEKGSRKIINFLKERSRDKIILVSSHDQKLIDVADKVIDIGDLNHLISSIRKT